MSKIPKVDIASDRSQFFDYFNLRPVPITIERKQSLEYLLFHYYVNGEEFALCYCADQWCRCTLQSFEEVNGTIQLVDKFAGEGDGTTEALLGLYIAASQLLDDEYMGYFKQIMEPKDLWEYLYGFFFKWFNQEDY